MSRDTHGTTRRGACVSAATRLLGMRHGWEPRPLHAQACARLGVPVCAWVCPARPGWVLVHLTRFLTRFDSVLFLSQFLNMVREPGS